jgi:hypothetical protein
MSTLDTAVVPLLIVYLHPNGVVRVSWEPGATNNSFMVLWTKDNSQKNQQAPITFSGSTTNICRDQSRVLNRAGFGNEEGTHIENIGAVKLETLETSRLLDVSGNVTGF